MLATDHHHGRPGVLAYTVRRRGQLLVAEDGLNLIVTSGRTADAQRAGGVGGGVGVITQVGFGETATAAAPENTALSGGAFWKAIDGVTYPAAGQVRFAFSLTVLEANGLAIIEFGLRDAAGNLYARKVRSGPIEKDGDVDLEGSWTISF